MMVSTRSVRCKFSEGERVLCYEPDPTKAKVLYDSKVLEVIENKAKRGKRSVEYLIHFQGWNSSWDRCVSEDFVLKDTEENRQLQRDLAERSQLQLGAYLYRRERKKGCSSSAGTAKKFRHGFSDDGSSSSTQPDDVETAADTDTSSGSASSAQRLSLPTVNPVCRAQIAIPPSLRDRLTLDYHLVVKRGKVSRLPASPSAAEILEAVVKWFGRAGAWNPPRGKHEPPQRPDILEVSARLNLMREVADGLRVYFDFKFHGHMLYKQEGGQFHAMCGRFGHVPANMTMREGQHSSEEEKGSPLPQNYAHSPPDPAGQDDEVLIKQEKLETTTSDEKDSQRDVKAERLEEEPPREEGSGNAGAVTVARRLRSRKSRLSQSEGEDVPSTSTEPKSCGTHSPNSQQKCPACSAGSSESSAGECGGEAKRRHDFRPPPLTRTPLSMLMDKVAKFELIPREGTEHLPSRVYGAIHLARLFVILPLFLNATQMPDLKLKLILKYVDVFVQYLDEHSEWFGESFYMPNTFLSSS